MGTITGLPDLPEDQSPRNQPLNEQRGYEQWAQAGGYFDGDGSVYLLVASAFVLKFGLVWVDNSQDQLIQLRNFMPASGVTLGNVLKHSENVFRLQIGSPHFVLLAAKALEQFTFKKREELRILIDYYEGRITGTEVLSKINELVRREVRLGKIRMPIEMPVYGEGKLLSAKARGRKAAQTRKAHLRVQSTRS